MVKKGSEERSNADFKAFQKRKKMEDILIELNRQGSSFPAELEKLTGIEKKEIYELLNELLNERLVEKKRLWGFGRLDFVYRLAAK